LISSMMASGPEANRPPHIWFDACLSLSVDMSLPWSLS
jgi:hypothetical protein